MKLESEDTGKPSLARVGHVEGCGRRRSLPPGWHRSECSVAFARMTPEPVPIHDARERAIAELSEHFAQDNLEMEEFERRVTRAHQAASVSELRELLGDLPGGAKSLDALVRVAGTEGETALAPVKASTAIVAEGNVRQKQTLAAILGGVQRTGSWNVPRRLNVRTVMGGAQLDFREARLPAGVTTVSIFSLMGGVEIIVPPDLSVEIEGTAIMGGFEHLDRTPDVPDPNRPVLRVTGLAIMGGVAVNTRLVGENDRQARRRMRHERREERRLARHERKLLRARKH